MARTPAAGESGPPRAKSPGAKSPRTKAESAGALPNRPSRAKAESAGALQGRHSSAKAATAGARSGHSSATAIALAERAAEVSTRLARAMPAPRVELDFEDAWQLLIATILSAQSTDRMVNRVTPELFRRYPTPTALAAADQDELEGIVKSTGFFRNKAKAIRGASEMLVEKFSGVVPREIEALVALPGVARKTANVVLGSAYGIPSGIVVDTHAGRVARRLGLTAEEDPVKVELALQGLFPRDAWIDTGHRFVLHGRYVCTARAPRCAACPLNELCPSAAAESDGPWTARADAERGLVAMRGEPRE